MNNRFRQGPYQLVELPVTNNTGRIWQFPDLPQLRNDKSQIIIIKAIELVPVTVLSTAPSGNSVSPATETLKAALVLYDEGWNKIYQMPLQHLNHSQDAGVLAGAGTFTRDIREFNDFKRVDWNKSYVNFFAAPAGSTYSILFGVTYARHYDTGNGKMLIDD